MILHRSVRTLIAACLAGGTAAALVPAASAQEKDISNASAPIIIAQNFECRGNKIFRPYHPQANRRGCVERSAVNKRNRSKSTSSSGTHLTLHGDVAIESDRGVEPRKCDGRERGGLCDGNYYEEIKFDRPFEERPHVIVSIESVSSQGGCVGGATDRVKAFATQVTEKGFVLVASGSPAGSSCGERSGWASRATASWIAIGEQARRGRHRGKRRSDRDDVPRPPICRGPGRALQWDGKDWQCRRVSFSLR